MLGKENVPSIGVSCRYGLWHAQHKHIVSNLANFFESGARKLDA